MNKRSLTALLLSSGLLLAGLLAYLPASPQDPVPRRLVLPNPEGRVVFTHEKHSQLPDMNCADCHHELRIAQKPAPEQEKQEASQIFSCKDCHGSFADPVFIKEHKTRFASGAGGAECLACHHNDSVEPAPDGKPLSVEAIAKLPMSACSECHTDVPGRMEAYHQRCMGCHDVRKAGPGSKAPCRQCHYP